MFQVDDDSTETVRDEEIEGRKGGAEKREERRGEKPQSRVSGAGGSSSPP